MGWFKAPVYCDLIGHIKSMREDLVFMVDNIMSLSGPHLRWNNLAQAILQDALEAADFKKLNRVEAEETCLRSDDQSEVNTSIELIYDLILQEIEALFLIRVELVNLYNKITGRHKSINDITESFGQ